MFKMPEEILNMISREMGDIKVRQIELLKVKVTFSEIKITPD